MATFPAEASETCRGSCILAGDQVLCEVADRLRAITRGSDTVARVGGDEFAFVLTRIEKAEDAGILARRVIDSLAIPVVVKGHHCSIGVSIGISIFPSEGILPVSLIKHADTAMYVAKHAEKNCFRYHVVLQRDIADSLEMSIGKTP